jgi:ABC-2 type transport system permease protein
MNAEIWMAPDSGTGAMTRAALLRIYLKEAKYESLRLLRTSGFVVPTLVFPLMFYTLFGIVLAGSRASGNSAAFLFVNYCVFGAVAPGLFGFGITLAIERDQGIVTYKRAIPMPPAAFLCAKMLMAMLFVTIVNLTLIVAGITLAHVTLSAAQYLQIACTCILGVLPFCAIGFLVGSLASSTAAPAVTNLIYLPMSFLSGLWVPLQILPKLIQSMVGIWPPYHLAQLARAAAGLPSAGASSTHAIVLAGLTLICATLAARRLARVG